MNPTTPANESLRFLLIEDSTVASIDLECILEDLGHTVTAVAASRRRAREAIRKHLGAFDAAIVDSELVGRSARPLLDALGRRGIPHAVANADQKPYTAARVADMLQRIQAV